MGTAGNIPNRPVASESDLFSKQSRTDDASALSWNRKMSVTPFGFVVGLVIVPFVILPIVASIGVVLLLAIYAISAFPLAAFLIGLTGGPCIVFGIVRWINYRSVKRPAEPPATTPDSNQDSASGSCGRLLDLHRRR